MIRNLSDAQLSAWIADERVRVLSQIDGYAFDDREPMREILENGIGRLSELLREDARRKRTQSHKQPQTPQARQPHENR